MKSISSRFTKRGGTAFTLIEMTVVIVIIGVLIGVSAPAIDGILRASRLTSTADNLRNFLSGAQQLAVAQNVEVEVRLYESPSATAPDAAPRVRTLRTYLLRAEDATNANGNSNGAGSYRPDGTPLKLDDALVISSKPNLSSLLSRPFKMDADADETVSDRYVSFHFYPDGSTDLPSSTQPWFLTVVEEKHAADESAPANFVTIQIHPTSGKLRTYRP